MQSECVLFKFCQSLITSVVKNASGPVNNVLNYRPCQ